MAKRKVYRTAKAASQKAAPDKEKAMTHHQGAADAKTDGPPAAVMRQAAPTIATPVPPTARRLRSGSAVVQVGGVQVTLMPDRVGATAGAAETVFNRAGGELSGYDYDKSTNTISRPGRAAGIRYTIQTTYAQRGTRSSPSAYGRGTTAADQAAGKNSLSFHEGSHGSDFLSYLAAHPLPSFTGRAGMTVAEYQAAVRTYLDALNEYDAAMREDSKRTTDCVGDPASDCI